MAEQLNQKFDELKQEFKQMEEVKQDMEEFKQSMTLEREEFKEAMALEMEEFKQTVPEPHTLTDTISEDDEDCKESKSYYDISPLESTWVPYYPPDPATMEAEPTPDPPPRVARSPPCVLHNERASVPKSGRSSRLSKRRVLELSADSENVDTSVNIKDFSAVYSEIVPSVVSISSFLGAAKIFDCSGLIIDWNSCENEATIVTSAKLLSSPKISGFETHLIVRLGDGTLLLAAEDYVDLYHNLIILKVKSDVEVKVVDLMAKQEDIVGGMNVCALGRSFYTSSLIDSPGKLHLEDPLFGCDELLRSTCNISMICEGGPLISDAGFVVGMNFFGNCVCSHLLPAPIILNCLKMWKSYSTVMRPLLGMSVVDVYPVPYKIWKRFKVSPEYPYVAVKEVYKGSHADINDVRSGDLVATCNGVQIKSAKQYYQLVYETSLAVTSCSGQQSFIVVINPHDGRSDSVSIEADNVSVNDSRFHDCWPRVEDDGWSRLKLKLFILNLKKDGKICRLETVWDDEAQFDDFDPKWLKTCSWNVKTRKGITLWLELVMEENTGSLIFFFLYVAGRSKNSEVFWFLFEYSISLRSSSNGGELSSEGE
ncbi:hypothetical protein POM88_028323 [Heracleum sosnowskyi]|uniref:PDZ domain-containing protein n=1 Tax=Heracleum sosnowskyi TaxID=360622 RepID=A0AAD8I9I1_9APIA|nr:hypothetical protein POM88_028323 [Heracleum sosnowskyi]